MLGTANQASLGLNLPKATQGLVLARRSHGATLPSAETARWKVMEECLYPREKRG